VLYVARNSLLIDLASILCLPLCQNKLIPPLNLRDGFDLFDQRTILDKDGLTVIISGLDAHHLLLLELVQDLCLPHLLSLFHELASLRKA
jgi:hypothetical protein